MPSQPSESGFGDCGQCGYHVFWYLNDSGKFAPPFEVGTEFQSVLVYDGEDWFIEEGRSVTKHVCRPEHKAQQDKRKAEYEKRSAAYSDHVRAAWTDAAPQSCPQCKSVPYAGCINMSAGKNSGKPTKWPHDRRHTKEWREKYG